MRYLLVLFSLLCFVPAFAVEYPVNNLPTGTKLAIERVVGKSKDVKALYLETLEDAKKNGRQAHLAQILNDWAKSGKITDGAFTDAVLVYRGKANPAAAAQPADRKGDENPEPKQDDFIKFASSYKFQTPEGKMHFDNLPADITGKIHLTVMGRLLHSARTYPVKNTEYADKAKLVKRAEAVVETWFIKYGKEIPMERLENGILTIQALLQGKDITDRGLSEETVDSEKIIAGLEVILKEDPKDIKAGFDAVLRGERYDIRSPRFRR